MPVTAAIVAVNVLVFAAMVFSGVSPGLPQIRQLIKWGADYGPLTLTSQPWRILTSNYVHIGILHIVLNMWCLWNLGAWGELIFGRWTYFLTYTTCGLAASIISLWWHPLGVGAGASGAIFGMVGALISALYLGHLGVPGRALRSTLRSLVTFAGYNLFFGSLIPGIDNSAHLGGLACGLGLGAILSRDLRAPSDRQEGRRTWVFLVAAIALIVAFRLVRQRALRTGLL
jgi:rhomboid protease GluP